MIVVEPFLQEFNLKNKALYCSNHSKINLRAVGRDNADVHRFHTVLQQQIDVPHHRIRLDSVAPRVLSGRLDFDAIFSTVEDHRKSLKNKFYTFQTGACHVRMMSINF
jgi:hypothetical protein